jgi:VWFA-related protein
MRTKDSSALSICVCVVIFTLFLAPTSVGQTSPPAQAVEFRKTVDLVSVFFTADDGHGTPVTIPTKDSLQLREDGRTQTIQRFGPATDLPVNVGIVMDTSGLMQGALPAAKAAAADFLRQIVTQKDLGFVISSGISVDLLQDLTSDVHLLRSGLDTARINVGLHSIRSGGLLHDAVYLAADEILSKQVGRKTLVVLTAGIDQGSKTKLKEAVQAAQKAGAVCYVVLFGRAFGSSVNDLTDQTGGRTFSVRDADKLADAMGQIARDLRNQYSLDYTSDNTHHDGAFRAIEIIAKEGYRIRARKGYFAPAN